MRDPRTSFAGALIAGWTASSQQIELLVRLHGTGFPARLKVTRPGRWTAQPLVVPDASPPGAGSAFWGLRWDPGAADPVSSTTTAPTWRRALLLGTWSKSDRAGTGGGFLRGAQADISSPQGRACSSATVRLTWALDAVDRRSPSLEQAVRAIILAAYDAGHLALATAHPLGDRPSPPVRSFKRYRALARPCDSVAQRP